MGLIEEQLDLQDKIIARLCGVYDPELPVNIYDLGLIYRIAVEAVPERPGFFTAEIDMTLTAPGCPVADLMPQMVHEAVADIAVLESVRVNLVWDPPWDPSRMSEAARFDLDMF